MNTPMAYIIAGPTASGKSDFAHALAKRIGGVVINCDSVQIYRGIESISASPFANKLAMSNEQLAINDESESNNCSLLTANSSLDSVPYRLFSILPLTEQISVAEYLELARAEYNAAINSGIPAVFVGGTGFYINAILNGISPIPEISAGTRIRAREMMRDHPDDAGRLLKNADPKTEYKDPQRATRALEVLLETGRPLSEWQSLPRTGAVIKSSEFRVQSSDNSDNKNKNINNKTVAKGDAISELCTLNSELCLKILINPPREILTERIARRIPEMMNGGLPAEALAKVGALDEARAIIASGGDDGRAIGASELVKFIRGEIGENECYENWITRTNQYAKRQRTWFRHQYDADIEIDHVPTDADLNLVIPE